MIDLMFITKVIAFIITIIILFFLVKEILGSIDRSNNNEKPDRKWDID
jgi:large-conductance mechanosensitive channel